MVASASSGIGRRVDRFLAWFHRWAGIVLGLLFVAWFVSGAVLLYVPFPSLPEQVRLAHSEPIEASKVILTPEAALAHNPGSSKLMLIGAASLPVYLTTDSDGKLRALAADDGHDVTFTPAQAATVAEHFSHHIARDVTGPFDYDQWIVHQHFDSARPFFKVSLDDVAGTELYVSARSGQVLQATTSRARAWNYCGAVLHWLYFTPLRKSWSAWNQVVWWVSFVALLATVAGAWLGIDRMVKSRRYSHSRWTLFRGWLRWHHLIGLFASIVVLAWMMSGWLSMDHGRLFSKGQPTPELLERFRGMSLRQVTQQVPTRFMDEVGSAAEVRFNAVAGRAFISAQGGTLAQPSVPHLDLLSGLRNYWPPPTSITPIPGEPLDFYAIAEGLGPAAQAFDVRNEHDNFRVYVDQVSGDPLVVMDPSRRAYAWVYYALHTFNFPLLLGSPLLRDIVILLQLALGLIFIATGIVVGYQRLGRTLSR
jgi:uncharacterized iron-regulated membrane protein